MPTTLRTIMTTTTVVAAVLTTALPATAAPKDDGPVFETPSKTPCVALDARYFDVEIDNDGNGNMSVSDDGIVNCNEWVVIRSYANSSAVIDNHEPEVGQEAILVHDLEAAGPAGVDFTIDLDPCWAGVEVHRDGDSPVHEQMIGDGCEMTVNTDFTGAADSADIHVVQQSGTIAPPHMWTVNGDDTTVLTGMPSGTWYVKVYDGFTPGSSIASTSTGSTNDDTLHGVADGSTVDIAIVTQFGLTSRVEWGLPRQLVIG